MVVIEEKTPTALARREGRLLLIAGAVLFLLIGLLWKPRPVFRLIDFKALDYASQALIQHRDPYREGSVLGVYEAAQETLRPVAAGPGHIVALCVNLPTALALAAPFALLPWAAARALWLLLTAGFYLVAAYQIWRIGARWSPRMTGLLLGLLLSGSPLLLEFGNLAGIAVGLCVLGAILIIRQRHVSVGMVCLALSLLLKPQDSGFIWLCLLLAGGGHGRRALQALGLAAILGVLPVLWVTTFAPHWPAELHANIVATSLTGKVNNPGPPMVEPALDGAMMVSLQTVTCLLVGEPGAYNAIAWLACAPLLLVWLLFALRKTPSPSKIWFALAAIAPLSMLPVYHRQHDTGLLMLAVPACALLQSRGGRLASAAAWLTAIAALACSCLFLQPVGLLTYPLRSSLTGTKGIIATIALARPVPFALLALAAFYVWLFIWRRELPEQISSGPAGDAWLDCRSEAALCSATRPPPQNP